MATTVALQPSVGGLPSQSNSAYPDFSKRSFAGILQQTQKNSLPNTDNLLFAGSSTDDANPLQNSDHEHPRQGSHRGFPALFIPEVQWLSLATTFKWSLVGKFSHGFNQQKPGLGRPPIKDLQTYFSSLDLKGDFTLGLLDNRHLLIQLALEEDFLRIYSRQVWRIGKTSMRIFKWTPNFHVQKESSLVPIWIALPRLPIHLFGKDILFRIASLVGVPLRLDSSTVSLNRPSVARLQIEIDLLKSRPEQVWIGYGEKEGFWQKVEYEDVPSYCQRCWRVGHDEQSCWIQNPGLKDQHRRPSVPTQEKQQTQQKYVVKSLQNQPVLGGEKSSNKAPVQEAQDQEEAGHLRDTVGKPVIEDATAILDAGPGAPRLRNTNLPEPGVQLQNMASSQNSDDLVSHAKLADQDVEFPLPVVFCGDGSTDEEEEDEVPNSNIVSSQDNIGLSVVVDKGKRAVEDEPIIDTTVTNLDTHSGQTSNTSPMDDGPGVGQEIATPLPAQDFPTGIYARQKIPLLRRSASTIGLIQSYQEDVPCDGNSPNLDNEFELEEDYGTEVHEEIIVMDQMGRLKLQLQPVIPVVTNLEKMTSPNVSSKTQSKSVISPVPSAPSPTASPGDDEVSALASLSAPTIVDSMTYCSSTLNQDEAPFQQPKNRGRKKKTKDTTQENTSRARLTARASFTILPEE